MTTRNPLLTVSGAGPDDAGFITSTLTTSWGDTTVAAHGELIDLGRLSTLVARLDGEPAGLLTYRPTGSDPQSWEITSLDSAMTGAGVGTALLDAVRARAAEAGVRRIWLVTTNDNVNALRFYQRRGYSLVAIHPDAVERDRQLKPGIPEEADGIPVRHELELELLL